MEWWLWFRNNIYGMVVKPWFANIRQQCPKLPLQDLMIQRAEIWLVISDRTDLKDLKSNKLETGAIFLLES